VLSRRGSLPPSLVRRLPLAGLAEIDVAVPTLDAPEGRFRMTACESQIAKLMFWEQGWKVFGYGAQVFYELAKEARVVVDAGANIGIYALVALAASPDSRVYAFEPVPRVYETLERNISLNGWDQRARLSASALADRLGTDVFSIPRDAYPESARLHSVARHLKWPHFSVKLDTVDHAVQAEKSLDLVKIDVEGAELLVLKGMTETLAAHAPNFWIELLPGAEVQQIEALVSSQGYLFFRETPEDTLVQESKLSPDVAGKYRNWYLIAPSRLQAFEQAVARASKRRMH
jgi:FkbM family methyltransferase